MTETLTVHEAAELLRVSKTTIRRKAMDGTLPALRLGSRLRFSRETLEGMLKSGNVAHTGEAQCTTGYTNGTTHRTGGHHGQKTGGQSGKARAFGSWLVQSGVSIHAVSGLLRHSDIRITARIYAHLGVEEYREAAAVLDAPPRLKVV